MARYRLDSSRQPPSWVEEGTPNRVAAPPLTAESVRFFERASQQLLPLDRTDPDSRTKMWSEFRARSGAYHLPVMRAEDAATTESALGFCKAALSAQDCARYWDNSQGCVVLVAGGGVCRLHDFRLELAQPRRAPCPRGVVVASVFRLPHAYRASRKYAEGLVRLARFVGARMPGMELRVLRDDSVTKAGLRAPAGGAAARAGGERDPLPGAARAWGAAWAELESLPHVSVTDFAAEAFRRGRGLPGHVDVFGTFARFLPLFDAPEGVPEWAAPPRDGLVTFVSDADFAGSPFDGLIMETVRWFSTTDHPLDVATFSFSVSTAERHQPLTAMPPLFAGALATKRRWPSDVLTDFLRDAARGRAHSRFAGRYAEALHAPAARNVTYERRLVDHMQSCVTFGADEAFLSRALLPRLMLRGRAPETWLFLVCPPVDRVVTTCLKSLEQGWERGRIGRAAAATMLAAADVAQVAVDAAAVRRGEVQPASVEKAWSAAAGRRSGLFARAAPAGHGPLPPADDAVSAPLREALRRMLGLWVRATTAGEAGGDVGSVSYATQCLGRLARPGEGGSGILSALTFSVGGQLPPRPAARVGAATAVAVQEELLCVVRGQGGPGAVAPAAATFTASPSKAAWGASAASPSKAAPADDASRAHKRDRPSGGPAWDDGDAGKRPRAMP